MVDDHVAVAGMQKVWEAVYPMLPHVVTIKDAVFTLVSVSWINCNKINSSSSRPHKK
jgi:hypothetical protein